MIITALERLIESKHEDNGNNSGWIITWGYHHLFHGTISRAILDKICPNRPLIVWHRSFHEIYLNSQAFDAMEFENLEQIKVHHQVNAYGIMLQLKDTNLIIVNSIKGTEKYHFFLIIII